MKLSFVRFSNAAHVRQTAHSLCARGAGSDLATPFIVTPDCRHRLDAVGAEYADPRGHGLALVPPPRSAGFGPFLFTTQPVRDVQQVFDRLGLEAEASALAVQSRDTHTPSFRWTIVDEAQRVAMQVVHNPYRCEGGDIVWGPPCARVPDPCREPRPADVPRYRVVEKLDDLYSDDTGPFLFMGYGEGNDYRTKRAALDEMAKLGVVVIGVNLANAPAAQRDLRYMDGDTERVLQRGTFFHLDTVFRPTPHGAFVFTDALPQDTRDILAHLYGAHTIVPLNAADCVRFACNGRLLRKSQDTLVLFYKANALPYDKVEQYAKAVNGTLSHESHDGYDVWVMQTRDANGCAQTLRMVPVPTEEVWKGGGSFSCITQLVPCDPDTPGPVRLLMAPPAHYKPRPEDALNALERELIASLSVANAWGEFEVTEQRVRAEGFTIIEMPLTPGFEEQIYTRDGTDGYVLRQGQLLDPAVHWPDVNDCYLVWESNIPDGPRQKEPAAMSQELVNVRLGRL